jgi:predicted RNase H-like nuclease
MAATGPVYIGVDGCKVGWVAAIGAPDVTYRVAVYPTVKDLLADVPTNATLAVDMPIGLPDRIEGGGRTPEKHVRPMLGQRQSSVFSIPARQVVEMGAQMSGKTDHDYPLHQRASGLAKTLSTPPKGVSIQAFYLFPKILELDAMLRAEPHLQTRLFESHPEVAFTVLNGGLAMREPKKVKGRVNPAGMEERIALLANLGVPTEALSQPLPKGAAADDVLDAFVCSLVAARIAKGEARCFPDPPERDVHGLPVAIWA